MQTYQIEVSEEQINALLRLFKNHNLTHDLEEALEFWPEMLSNIQPEVINGFCY